MSITFATMITLSVLGLGMATMNTFLIRDAAIAAASKAALRDAPSQRHYLLRLLDTNLPHLASFEVRELNETGLVGFEVASQLPGLGLFEWELSRVRVYAAKEQL